MMQPQAFYDQNSNLIRLKKLKNARTKALVVAGVGITAQLRAIGSPTPLATVTLSYDGSNGDWSGVFPVDVGAVVFRDYEVYVLIDGGTPEAQGELVLPVTVYPRSPAVA